MAREAASLRQKLTISVGVMVLIPLAVITVLSLCLLTQRLEQDLAHRVRSAVALVRQLMDNSQEELFALGDILAADSGLQVDLSLEDTDAVRQFLTAKRQLYRVDGIAIRDMRGRLIAQAGGRDRSGNQPSERPDALQSAASGPAIVGVHAVEQRLLLSVYAPIVLADGTRIGVLEMDRAIDAGFLFRLKEMTGADLTLFLGSQLCATTLAPEDAAVLAPGGSRTRQSGAASRPSPAAGQAASMEQFGRNLVARGIPFDDLDKRAVGVMLVTLSRDSMRQAQRLVAQPILVIGLVTLLLVVLVGFLLARGMTRPLRDLVQATRSVASGDLSRRVTLRTKDEIGQLGEAFNKMTEDLALSLEHEKALTRAAAAAEAESRRANEIEQAYQELAQLNAELHKEVAQRRQAEAKLVSYAQALEDSNRELGDFTYIVSHDLKEPLRSINAFAKFVLTDYRDQLGEEGRGYLGRVQDNAKRMQQLIDDLLEVSRLSRRANEFQEVRVADLLEEVRLRLAYALKEKGVQLLVDGPLPTLLGDRVRLTEVFANLISNAIKYNDKPECRITIGCRLREDGYYQFSVRDNGSGIEPQYFDKIFEIFQRLGKREAQEGTGVGLTIVKKIVELHHGTIWVESAVGQGTTFHFTIPKDEATLRGKPKLGEVLLAKRLITETQLQQALDEQSRGPQPPPHPQESP